MLPRLCSHGFSFARGALKKPPQQHSSRLQHRGRSEAKRKGLLIERNTTGRASLMALSGQSVSIDTASAPDATLPVENPLQAVIVCAPNAGDCSRLTGGITLAERLYRQLQELND